MSKLAALTLILLLGTSPAWAAQIDPGEYRPATQAELVAKADTYVNQKVQVTGTFLFTGSDFCYQIRRTKINTRDYFCFALGTPSLVRLYLKKDHEQADELLNVRKGAQVTAYGTFDSLGADYSYVVVDAIEVRPAP